MNEKPTTVFSKVRRAYKKEKFVKGERHKCIINTPENPRTDAKRRRNIDCMTCKELKYGKFSKDNYLKVIDKS